MNKHTLILFALAGALFFSGCNIKKQVVNSYERNIKKAPFDVIIVPGYPYNTDNKDSILNNFRMYWAKELYDKGIAKNIIFSGAAVHTPYVEGTVMKIIADSLGIPANHTYKETEALHTTSNARLGKKMAKSLGFKKIAVATDPYQFAYMKLLMWFSAPGIPILSFAMDSAVKYTTPLPHIDASGAFVKDFVPLKKR